MRAGVSRTGPRQSGSGRPYELREALEHIAFLDRRENHWRLHIYGDGEAYVSRHLPRISGIKKSASPGRTP